MRPGEKDSNAGHGAISRIAVEAEGVECIGEGGTEVEPIEDLAEVQVARQGIGEGAEETPGNDRGPDDDGRGLRAVAGQDHAGVGRPTVSKGRFERGQLRGGEKQSVIAIARGLNSLGWGLRRRLGGDCRGRVRFRTVRRCGCLLRWRGDCFFGRQGTFDGFERRAEEVLPVLLERSEGFLATAGCLVGAGERCGGATCFGFDEVGVATQNVGVKGGAQSFMHRAELEFCEGVVEAPNTGAIEVAAERVPGIVGGGMHLAPVLEDVVLVGAEMEVEAALANFAEATQKVEAGGVVLVGEDGVVIAGERESFVDLDAVERAAAFVSAG